MDLMKWVAKERGMPGDITLEQARRYFANADCLVKKRREGLDVQISFVYVSGSAMPDTLSIAEFRILSKARRAFIRLHVGDRSIDATPDLLAS